MQMLNDLVVMIVWVPIAVVMLKAVASVVMPSVATIDHVCASR